MAEAGGNTREPGADDPHPQPRRRSRARAALWWVLTPLLVGAVALTAAGLILRSPYVTFAPGSATATEPLISVPGEAEDRTGDHSGDGGPAEHEGRILFTTVSVVQKPTYAQSLWGWWSPAIDVFPRRRIYGDQSPEAARRQSLARMNDSKAVAAAAALERLGKQVPETGTGVLVIDLREGFAAARELAPGDAITELDHEATPTSADLIEAVSSRSPGEEVTLTVERAEGGTDADGPSGETVTTTLGRRRGTDEAILGVTVRTRDRRFDLPVDVDISSGDVGGPSAGLAFSLGVIEDLTSASLTGDRTVAVTGEINADGSVDEVGGIAQKAVAARERGAVLFIVPAAEAGAARAAAGGMAVAGVENLEGALDVLADIGGDVSALPGPPPGQ